VAVPDGLIVPPAFALAVMVCITRKSAQALALAPGTPVYAQIKGVAVLDVESGTMT
jgi:molybdopterin-binding protein